MPENLEQPFAPRPEISADAEHIANHIVMHMWILFVVIPVFFGMVILALKVFG